MGAWLACVRNGSLKLDRSSAGRTIIANGQVLSPIETPHQLQRTSGPYRHNISQKKGGEEPKIAYSLVIQA